MAVVKKSSVEKTKKPADGESTKLSGTAGRAVSAAEEALLEEEIFGDSLKRITETGAAPTPKKGVKKVGPASEPPSTGKTISRKTTSDDGSKKTKIIRKPLVVESEVPAEPQPAPATAVSPAETTASAPPQTPKKAQEPEELPLPSFLTPMPVRHTAPERHAETGKKLDISIALKAAEEKKRKEKEKEKERLAAHDPKNDVKSLEALEKAIKNIKEETPPVDESLYEEYEEVVEEVVEEIEYQEELTEGSEIIAKKKPDEPAQSFGGRRRRKKKKKKTVTDSLATKDAVKRTMAAINVENTATRKKYRRTETEDVVETESNILKVSDFMSVSEIANLIEVKPAEVIAACMKLGFMVTINQRLDFTTLEALVDEFGYKAELMEEYAEETLLAETEDDPSKLEHRPPIVTVMGHVDHGKTSLLDYIRKTNVTAGESGGITQHIGAYQVQTTHGKVTFLDTPGHEAFATMRARGARATDLIILVVAADSNVMPQTIESIDHAKAAGVKIVVALNKMDLPSANPQHIKTQLAQQNVLVEDFGGQTVCIEISCKSGLGIQKLLESVAIESELLDLKANPNRPAVGTIIESKMDSRLGSVATVLITNGTLSVGDNFVTGPHHGRVKVMTDEHGTRIEAAGPSSPVQVLGLSGTPRAGDTFTVVENEKVARDIAVRRSQAEKERENRQIKHISLDDLYSEIKSGIKDLNVVVKGDVDGSVEALSDALQKLTNENFKVNIVHKSVGAINESNILLASATNAVIIGFHVHPNSKMRELAQKEGVEIRLYKIIYEAIEDLEKAIQGMLEPKEKEVILGTAEVRNSFKISKVGTIAGCMITSGLFKRSAKVRVLRAGTEVTEARVASLKRLKDDVSEVAEGYECGIFLENFNDFQEGDIFESFEIQKIKNV